MDGLPTCSLLVAGEPAVEQQGTSTAEGPLDGPDLTQLNLVTAVQAGSTIVKFTTALGTDAPADTVNRILAAGRDFEPEEIPELHGP